MKMKFGALVVAGSGKIGGHVASRNKGGSYLRTKTTPSNPSTSAQVNVRGKFKQFSQGWRGLTQVQRDAWNAVVDQWKTKDVFSDDVKPSGMNLYIRLNQNIALVGAAAISSPPVPASIPALTSGSATVVGATGVVTLTFAPTVPAGVAMVVEATAPISAGRSFVKNLYRRIKSIAAAQTSPQVLTTEYAAVHGNPSGVGEAVWFRIYYVNLTTGQKGAASVISAVIS